MLDEKLPEMPPECCGRCKFYLTNRQKISEGACRRFPPHPNLIIGAPAHPNMPPQMLIKADLPPVGATEWCGEFQIKPSMLTGK